MRGGAVRKQILVVAAAVLVIAVGLLAWFVVGQRPSGFLELNGRTNVVFSILGDDGTRDAITVLSLAPDEVFALQVPRRLQLKTSRGAFRTAARLDPSDEAEPLGKELEGLLGIEIPHYVEVDADALAAWIDELGGVTIRSDTALVYFDGATDPAILTELAPGTHVLDGRTFVAVLLHGEGTDPAERTARQRRLLAALGERLLGDPDAGDPGPLGRAEYAALATDLSFSQAKTLVERIRAVRADRFDAESVPGDVVQAGGERVVRPRAVELERTIAARIKGLELRTPSDVRVAVFNGNGVRLMARQTADYLAARGFVVTQVANAESFDYATSYVVVLTEEENAWILRDALPSSVRIVLPENFEAHYRALESLVPDGTDVMLIVGAGMGID